MTAALIVALVLSLVALALVILAGARHGDAEYQRGYEDGQRPAESWAEGGPVGRSGHFGPVFIGDLAADCLRLDGRRPVTAHTPETLLTSIRDLLSAPGVTVAHLDVDAKVRVDSDGSRLVVVLSDEGHPRHEFDVRCEQIVDCAAVQTVASTHASTGWGFLGVTFHGVRNDGVEVWVDVDLDTLDELAATASTAMRYIEADLGDGHEWHLQRRDVLGAQAAWIYANPAEARERYDLS